MEDTQMSCCSECKEQTSVLDKYPQKKQELVDFLDSLSLSPNIENNRSFLINSLHRAQGIFGYLPEEVQLLIAEKLRLNLSDVYGVISFYSFFTTKPPGKYKINICMGTACFVRGADKILKEFEEKLNIKDGETSEDLKFSLGGLRCVGACSLAPVVLVNEEVYANVTPDQISKIINKCV